MLKLTLLALLCAGCTTVSVQGPKPLKCGDFVPEELKADTPHAGRPMSADSKAWVNFAVAEAGQLNKANADKRIGWQICKKVEEANDGAAKGAERRNRPWYRRIF